MTDHRRKDTTETETDILADLRDLHKQATIDRSHFYTGAIILRAIAEIEAKRITIDIGQALTTLQASPELCAEFTELVGGPALVEAQEEVVRLQSRVEWLEEEVKRNTTRRLDDAKLSAMRLADLKNRINEVVSRAWLI
jgi:hypothetical protein